MTESDIVLKESGGSFPRPGFDAIGVGQTNGGRSHYGDRLILFDGRLNTGRLSTKSARKATVKGSD